MIYDFLRKSESHSIYMRKDIVSQSCQYWPFPTLQHIFYCFIAHVLAIIHTHTLRHIHIEGRACGDLIGRLVNTQLATSSRRALNPGVTYYYIFKLVKITTFQYNNNIQCVYLKDFRKTNFHFDEILSLL